MLEHKFDPFCDNGGTTLAIAGEDFCVIASDTRLSEGYSINSRYQPHCFKLNETSVFAGNGMYADTVELSKQIRARQAVYAHQHNKEMSITALAQMTSIMLYQKRFFPYYVFTIIGGVDSKGKGAVFSYDPVGSYEREIARCGGSAASLIQPFLDNQIKGKNLAGKNFAPVSQQEAIKIAKDAFTSATERDIHTGDYLEVFVVTAAGVTCEKFDLKKD